MLTPNQVKFFKEQLATARNPLFLFDDDQDGLCSFLLLYRINREGHGVIIKSIPRIDRRFFRKVQEYNPDKVFILDIPMVEQEFIDAVKRPVFWIDHHSPLERQNIHYFNPRLTEPEVYLPTTRMAYQISQNSKNLWIAMVGCIGDYHLPDFKQEFIKKYPDLLKKDSTIDQAIYQDPIGKLSRLFAFILKGKTSEVNQCIKILTRIKSPYEILNQTTPQGKYLYKRFENVNQKYQALLEKTKKKPPNEKLLLFVYTQQSWSFTSELAGELLHFHPHKIVIIARKKSGEMKCSLRSKETPIPPILENALIGIDGYGGGHEFACGANIKEHDWQQFLTNFKMEIKK